MNRRLISGFLFLFGRRNEKFAGWISGLIMLAIAFFAPQPRRTVVDGQEIVEAIAFGRVVPSWLVFAIAGGLLLAIYFLFLKLFDSICPEPKSEIVEVEKVFERADGGYVAWQPEVPGTPSPMEYTPPKLDQNTSAKEFLTTLPPHPMRTLLGVDTMEELEEFDQLLVDWLRTAPEATLLNLIPAAKELQDAGLFDDDADYRLIQAYTERGIPSKEEYEALTGESLE